MTPTEAAAEIAVAIRAAGAWPQMREEQLQLQQQIRDTLRRFQVKTHVRAVTALAAHCQLEEREERQPLFG